MVNAWMIISVAVKDDEIEDWAAKKIQSSFKQYKHQKTLSRYVHHTSKRQWVQFHEFMSLEVRVT